MKGLFKAAVLGSALALGGCEDGCGNVSDLRPKADGELYPAICGPTYLRTESGKENTPLENLPVDQAIPACKASILSMYYANFAVNESDDGAISEKAKDSLAACWKPRLVQESITCGEDDKGNQIIKLDCNGLVGNNSVLSSDGCDRNDYSQVLGLLTTIQARQTMGPYGALLTAYEWQGTDPKAWLDKKLICAPATAFASANSDLTINIKGDTDADALDSAEALCDKDPTNPKAHFKTAFGMN